MTSRLLPPEEWKRLTGTELETVMPYLQADHDAHVIVVEDDDGQLVGCWAMVRIWHAEGLWVDPAHRGRSSVIRHLLRMFRQLGQALHVPGVMTASTTEDVSALLSNYGAEPLPGTHWMMPLQRGE